VVLGLLQFDPDVKIKGVVLNQVAGVRHENLLRSSIEKYCNIPVLGAIPKLGSQYFPERHMGLTPTPEHAWAIQSIQAAAEMVESHVNIPELLAIAQAASAQPFCMTSDELPEPLWNSKTTPSTTIASSERYYPKIGIIRDSAFQFYYPDNLEALESAGAKLIFISPLIDNNLPEIDALYIGGGFPETHAEQLSKNFQFRNEIKAAAENGLPIYAECGGLMYLGESLVLDQSYPMAGVLPVVFGFSKKPQGHGYTIAEVVEENPYYQKGSVIKGHEFHYSKVLEWNGNERDMAFLMGKGRGIQNQRDGICYKNVFATYTHIHALGVKDWAAKLVDLASSFAGLKIKSRT
jgi:cobyrinic acid a,c-diamide synthase